ncbi:MAG: hypothetical protein V4695_01830 [Pseudomonadota bacterium]
MKHAAQLHIMELINLQFSYDDVEDRLLLRIAASENDSAHELRAWLTRRFITSFWGALQRALAVQMTLVHPGAAHASAELIDMAHQSAIDTLALNGAFGERFRSDLPPHSALAAPFLVVEAKFHIVAKEPMRINFLPSEGAGIEIAFDDTELHGFCSLLLQSIQASQWDLPLQLDSAWEEGKVEDGGVETGFDAPVAGTSRLLN